MAGRIFTKSSSNDVFAVLFVNGGTALNQSTTLPSKFLGFKTSIFGAKMQTQHLQTAAASK